MKLFSIFRKTKSAETLAQNALRFCSVAAKLAEDERLVAMYPHPGWRTSRNDRFERYGWVCMPNPLWRERVLNVLNARQAKVKDATFHAPDSLDGWTFTAISTVPVPRIAQLTLEDFV